MTYLNAFVTSLEELTKYNKEYKRHKPNFMEISKAFYQFESMRDSELYTGVRERLKEIAEGYVSNAPPGTVINKCHGMSHGLWELYNNSSFSGVATLSVTIGNVYYKGHNIYGLSNSKLKRIIRSGPTSSESLDLHVWLTLEDMTVIDLSIIPTLIHRGMIEKKQFTSPPILFWHERDSSDFIYEPMLVDNDFIYRVDTPIQIK